jgi:hypothetical protein
MPVLERYRLPRLKRGRLRLHKLDPEAYLRDLFRVLAHWPRDRYLELAPKYWAQTRKRADLESELASVEATACPGAGPRDRGAVCAERRGLTLQRARRAARRHIAVIRGGPPERGSCQRVPRFAERRKVRVHRGFTLQQHPQRYSSSASVHRARSTLEWEASPKQHPLSRAPDYQRCLQLQRAHQDYTRPRQTYRRNR